MHPLLADPWVAAQIDAAVEPYRKLWPAEAIEAFREEMAITLETHPAAQKLMRQARPAVVERSEELPTGGKAPADSNAGDGGTGHKNKTGTK